MKLPNGYGSVTKLSGNRRKPYLARVTLGWVINKETGKEDYIDATNFSGEDYDEMLSMLGAKIQNEQPIKVTTIKK